MKKWWPIFLAVMVGFCGCDVPQKEATVIPSTPADDVYQLIITAELVTNDSVGEEWSKRYMCEGEVVYSGQLWTVPHGTIKQMEIETVITERDKCPDVGSGRLIVELQDGVMVSTVITVRENYGRYSGNIAKWDVTCRVERV